jgi:hypothetical protein
VLALINAATLNLVGLVLLSAIALASLIQARAFQRFWYGWKI